MKYLVLFVVMVTFLVYSMAQEPSVYVEVSWDMSSQRLCILLELFAKTLSAQLFETRGVFPYQIKPERIRFMNSKSLCEDKGQEEDTVLDFFVSKNSNVDRNLTILAYKILYDYWKNKRMVLLDDIFIGKVNKVELLGKDKPDIPAVMSESTRIGIGIAIGLSIVFVIVAISLTVSIKRKAKKPPHGVIVTSVPLHVIRTEPSEPSITIEPPAYEYDERYEFDRQDGLDRRNQFDRQEASYNGYTPRYNVYDDEPVESPML